jgi:hypothetical protein
MVFLVYLVMKIIPMALEGKDDLAQRTVVTGWARPFGRIGPANV